VHLPVYFHRDSLSKVCGGARGCESAGDGQVAHKALEVVVVVHDVTLPAAMPTTFWGQD
jgi:hypothetical protein